MNSSFFLQIFLVVLFSFVFTSIHAGTWLSFNDFKEDGEGGPVRRLGDVVTSCKDTQKRLAKRAYLGERVTRAEQENDAICRILMRMGRR
ncbi:unnamed protein product [Caenorhabditis angaria]|uniref:Uncharacterized protein n=1 Tax=Caenorhabditis angaria TaxID=860376 RepID=A0A9P1MVQ7_9PELO|nr:unnamed protein product [Caenorhabditis angaria]